MAIRTSGSGGSIKFSGTGGSLTISSSGGGGGGGSLPLMTNISAWYDAEDIMQADDSDITSWADKSGNGNNLSYHYAGGGFSWYPRLDTTGTYFNGKKSVKFDHVRGGDPTYPQGFSMYFAGDPATGNIPTGSDPVSMYAVFKTDLAIPFQFNPVISVGQTYNRLNTMGAIDVNGANGWAKGSPQNSGGSPDWLTWTEYNGQPNDIYQANTDAKITSFIIGAGEQIQNSELLVNGSSAAQVSTNSSSTTLSLPSAGNNTEIVLGGLAGERSFMGYDTRIAHGFSGRIAEVILYKTQHTSTERNQILAYLAAKHGISV
jgi:hypothetical protein